MKFQTKAIKTTENKFQDSKPVSTPIYLSTTFERNESGDYTNDFQYTRGSNPNRRILEESIAALENGFQAFAFSSGMAAVSAILQTLKPGDHIIFPDDAYHGIVELRESILDRWGLEFTVIDMTDLKLVDESIQSNTKLIWAETPSNPMLKISDLEKISEIAKSKNILFAVDNTWPTPVLQNPLDLGADIVMHSTTKYFGGHSDVLGGAVIINENKELVDLLSKIQKYSGAVPSPFDCWLISRGIQTLHLRVSEQSRSAMKLALFLESHPKIKAVFYPGLKRHPNHDIASKQMHDHYGAMISVLYNGTKEETFELSRRFNFFTTATSLGGTESLIEHRRSVEGEHSNTPENLLRISVGLEHVDDLIDDWKKALS